MKRILINSLPKSGTHLLSKGAELFGYKEYFRHDGYVEGTPIFLNHREVKNALKTVGSQKDKFAENHLNNAVKEEAGERINLGALTPLFVESPILRRWLDVIPANRYILGHIPWNPRLRTMLQALNYRHLFMIRDPRAALSSQLTFILDSGKMPADHFLKEDFKEMSRADQLHFLLKGGYAKKAGVEIKSFAKVYRSMLPWREEPECLLIRFEDLIGEKGGGSRSGQRNAVRRIAAHLGISQDAAEAAFGKIYDPNARTFSSGKIDGWKTSMEPGLIHLLSEACEPLCREAGYEN